MSGPLNVLPESKMTDIFGVVSLMHQVNRSESPEDAERLSAAMAALSDADAVASWLVYKLMEGKRYGFSGDRPEFIDHLCAVANAIGATVASHDIEPDGRQTIVFQPPRLAS
jgi:hypothetical protein